MILFPIDFDASDTLDYYWLARVIFYFGFDCAESPSLVHRQRVCEIRDIRKSGRSDGNFLAVSENIFKIRLRYFVLRIICRFNPFVIDLRRYSGVQDGASIISLANFVRAVARLNCHRKALDGNDYRRSL